METIKEKLAKLAQQALALNNLPLRERVAVPFCNGGYVVIERQIMYYDKVCITGVNNETSSTICYTSTSC